jgi:hypothetical protein
MKTSKICFGSAHELAILVSVPLMLIASITVAAPLNGFSINAGGVSNSMTATLNTGGSPYSYSSSGLSVGIDYQVALSENFTLNPFLMSSGESTAGSLKSGTTAGHGMLGLQLRYWISDVYIGGHFASYSEALVNSASNPTTTSGAGGGGGIVVGWEPLNSKWYLMGQYDSANLNFTDADVKLTGARISVGYRWK